MDIQCGYSFREWHSYSEYPPMGVLSFVFSCGTHWCTYWLQVHAKESKVSTCTMLLKTGPNSYPFGEFRTIIHNYTYWWVLVLTHQPLAATRTCIQVEKFIGVSPQLKLLALSVTGCGSVSTWHIRNTWQIVRAKIKIHRTYDKHKNVWYNSVGCCTELHSSEMKGNRGQEGWRSLKLGLHMLLFWVSASYHFWPQRFIYHCLMCTMGYIYTHKKVFHLQRAI